MICITRARYKLKAKEYADQSNNRRELSLKEGDAVLIIKNLRPRKADPLYFDQHFTLFTRYHIVAPRLACRVRRASKGILHTTFHSSPQERNTVELEAEGSGNRPLSHLKRLPNRNISIDCDKYKDAVCNQDLRSKIDCAKFRLAVFGSDQGGSSSSEINPSVVNTDDNKCLSDQFLCSEPVRVSNRIRKPFEVWQHSHGDSFEKK